jgi:hypothetical protein
MNPYITQFVQRIEGLIDALIFLGQLKREKQRYILAVRFVIPAESVTQEVIIGPGFQDENNRKKKAWDKDMKHGQQAEKTR